MVEESRLVGLGAIEPLEANQAPDSDRVRTTAPVLDPGGTRRVEITPKRNVAFFEPKITLALSAVWKG